MVYLWPSSGRWSTVQSQIRIQKDVKWLVYDKTATYDATFTNNNNNNIIIIIIIKFIIIIIFFALGSKDPEG